jgi:hypothetical protein
MKDQAIQLAEEAEKFLGLAGKELPSRYEVRCLGRLGRIRVAFRCDSLMKAKSWLFYHPGERYWIIEIRQSVGIVAEYDLTSSQRAQETCLVAAGLLAGRS